MIQAVFFDIGGTVHTQDATPESDRDYIRRLWCFLHMNHITQQKRRSSFWSTSMQAPKHTSPIPNRN